MRAPGEHRAAPVKSFGATVRFQHANGLDPLGFQTFTDFRLEAAGGDSSYGRGAVDPTLSRAVTRKITAALTASLGTSVGSLPVQRRWFLGDARTVRGQRADTVQSGDSFWLGRMELARAHTPGFRTALFGDLGWVGDRAMLNDGVRPMTGAGVGLSVLDGLLRFDVARGFHPRKQTRLDLYLNAPF